MPPQKANILISRPVHPDTTDTAPEKKSVLLSVIIPIRNEAQNIRGVLAALYNQTLQLSLYEIIIVDGMSTDDSFHIVREWVRDVPHFHLIQNPKGLASSSRNLGVRVSKGRYLAFIDGHCVIPSPFLLERILEAFQNRNRCLSRPQPLVPSEDSPVQKAISIARSSWLGHFPGSKIYSFTPEYTSPMSAGFGYDRDLFLSIGGYDETFDACEDVELNLRIRRLGITTYHHPEFQVGYIPRESLQALFDQLFRYGVGRGLLAKKHRRFSFPTSIPAIGLVVSSLLVTTFALGFFPRWIVVGCLSLYALLLTGTSLFLSLPGTPHLIPRVTLCFLCIHFGAATGYICGFLRHAPSFGESAGIESARSSAIEAEQSQLKNSKEYSSTPS